MTDKITITIGRDILEHTVVALEYAYNSNDEMVMESIRFLRHALAAQPADAQQKPVAWRHSKTGQLYDLEEEVPLADGDECADPLYAAQPAPAAVPPGYALVPIEPTPEMVAAIDKVMWPGASEKAYRAMIEAAGDKP